MNKKYSATQYRQIATYVWSQRETIRDASLSTLTVQEHNFYAIEIPNVRVFKHFSLKYFQGEKCIDSFYFFRLLSIYLSFSLGRSLFLHHHSFVDSINFQSFLLFGNFQFIWYVLRRNKAKLSPVGFLRIPFFSSIFRCRFFTKVSRNLWVYKIFIIAKKCGFF